MGLIKQSIVILFLLFSTSIFANTAYLKTPYNFYQNDQPTWDKLGKFLIESNYSTYVLNWTGNGGLVAYGNNFIHYIQQAQIQGKTITIRLIGHASSMHAIVTCYADKIISRSAGYLLFHAEGATIEGKYGRFSKANTEKVYLDNLRMCLYKGIITDFDINLMWEGDEVYKYYNFTDYLPDPRELIE